MRPRRTGNDNNTAEPIQEQQHQQQSTTTPPTTSPARTTSPLPTNRTIHRSSGNTLGSGVLVACLATCVYALCRRYPTVKVVAALVLSLFGASFLRRFLRMFHHHFTAVRRTGILHRRLGGHHAAEGGGVTDRRLDYPALFIRGADGRIERASGIAVSLALHQGDFGPDDYEDLLLLDEQLHTDAQQQQQHLSSTQQHTPGGATMSAISALPTYVLPKPGQTSTPPFEILGGCSVCLADFEPGDTAKRAPCASHVFHQKCLDPWLKIKNACPVCRAACNEVGMEGGGDANKNTLLP